MVRACLAILMTMWLAIPAQACRQALAMGLDVSGSVDSREYSLQLNGLADALSNAEVIAALLAQPDAPVNLAIYEWSGGRYQRLIIDWTAIEDRNTIDAVADRLRRWTRSDAPENTGLGAAMRFGAELLRASPNCDQWTLDISGDGKNNDWPRPIQVKNSGALASVTVNSLVIAQERMTQPDVGEAGDVADLTAYFRARVIHGPQAFIEVALGFEDYADAMKRKLLREIATLILGGSNLGPPASPNG